MPSSMLGVAIAGEGVYGGFQACRLLLDAALSAVGSRWGMEHRDERDRRATRYLVSLPHHPAVLNEFLSGTWVPDRRCHSPPDVPVTALAYCARCIGREGWMNGGQFGRDAGRGRA